MSVIRKLKLCTSEEYEDKTTRQPKRAYYRIGDLIEFKDDKTGDRYFRGRLSHMPSVKIYVFPEDDRPTEKKSRNNNAPANEGF